MGQNVDNYFSICPFSCVVAAYALLRSLYDSTELLIDYFERWIDIIRWKLPDLCSECTIIDFFNGSVSLLSHWGRVMHICVANLTIIGSDNGLSPGRRQAIIGTNAGILLIRTLGTNFSEILNEVHTFSFKKMHLKYRLENGGHFVSASMC